MQRGRRAKRKGRVDYRKLSLGSAEWKSDDETGTNKVVKEKESPVKTAPIETYLMMLYVTLEQEKALKEFFLDNGWPFLKTDFSALTEKTGTTVLNQKKTTGAKKGGSTPTAKQSRGTSKGQSDTETKSTPHSHVKSAKIVKKEIVTDRENSEEERESDTVKTSIVSPASKRRKMDKSPVVSLKRLPSTMTEESKLDGTESVPDVNEEDDIEDLDDIESPEDSKSPDKQVPEVDEFDNDDGQSGKTDPGTPGKRILSLKNAGKFVKKAVKEKRKAVESGSIDNGGDEGDVDDDAEEIAKEILEEMEFEEGEELDVSDLHCWECEKELKDETDYGEHMLKEHCFDVKSGRYYCEPCNKYFKQPDYLKDHNKHIHEGKKRRPQKTTRDHVCDKCGSAFKRPDQLKEHVSMVHYKKLLNSHECEICGKKFARPRLLGYHMNRHIGNKPFQCSTCGHSYFSRGGLYVHTRMCQRVIPVVNKCDICHKNFSNQYALKVHMLGIHSKSQPAYRCSCGKLLKWKTSIKKHKVHCPNNAANLAEITREEYDNAVSRLLKPKVVKTEDVATEEIIYKDENDEVTSEVTEVTDEKLVEEITGKIADELSKSGKVDTEEEKMITETIRNAVLSGEETQVITIPRPSGTGSEDSVYYVIVNPAPDQQIQGI